MAGAVDMACKKAAKAVMEVINSSHFDRENIRRRKLTLSPGLLFVVARPGERGGGQKNQFC